MIANPVCNVGKLDIQHSLSITLFILLFGHFSRSALLSFTSPLIPVNNPCENNIQIFQHLFIGHIFRAKFFISFLEGIIVF